MSWANGYAYRALFTFNVHPTSSLTGFPNLILGTYAQLATVAHGGYVNDVVTFNGIVVPADLIFTSDSSGTTLLYWEIESYNSTTGAIVAWVKSDRSSSADTVVYCWVGNAAVTTYQCWSTGVWDSNHKLVCHFPDGTTLSALDYTVNSNNGSLSATPPTAVSGVINGGARFVAANSEKITFSDSVCLLAGSNFTIEAWLQQVNIGYTSPTIRQGDSTNRIQIINIGSTFYVVVDNGSNSYGIYTWPDDGAWHHMVVTYDGSQSTNATKLILYQDGIAQTLSFTGTIPTSLSTSTGFRVGDGTTDGNIDELRISNNTRSADWIAHSYRQQAQGSAWYSVGSWLIPITVFRRTSSKLGTRIGSRQLQG